MADIVVLLVSLPVCMNLDRVARWMIPEQEKKMGYCSALFTGFGASLNNDAKGAEEQPMKLKTVILLIFVFAMTFCFCACGETVADSSSLSYEESETLIIEIKASISLQVVFSFIANSPAGGVVLKNASLSYKNTNSMRASHTPSGNLDFSGISRGTSTSSMNQSVGRLGRIMMLIIPFRSK